MGEELILLGTGGSIAGIILIILKSVFKKDIEYKLSVPITIISFSIFIVGLIITPEVRTTSSTPNTTVDTIYSSRMPTTTWNVQDLNVETNGNAVVAINLLASGRTGDVIEANPAAVFKAPWKYYGKTLKMTGLVSIAQDYPPGSNVSVNLGGGGEVGELVMVADDATIIDYIHLGSTDNINVGDTVIIYGYCVGHVKVENQVGGTTTQLMLIGNKVQVI